MRIVVCIISLVLLMLCFACREKSHVQHPNQDDSFFQQVRLIPDSIHVDDIVVYNLFKYQILAHSKNSFDSAMIVGKVYRRQPKIWNELYGILFDSVMFSTAQGMIDWNRRIFREREDSIRSRVTRLMDVRFDSALRASITGMKRLTGHTPDNVRLSIILSPMEGIGFGGIERDAFILDLIDNNFDVVEMVEEGIPHELNHFIYEPRRESDPDRDTPLRLTIDEGFACYYAYRYFDGKISKARAVEQMTEDEWSWYMHHEKEIYEKCAQHFFYQGNNDPLRNLGPELGAPKTLFYWLGFRIVEAYVERHGKDSWKDIYDLPVREVLKKSGYPEYVEALPQRGH